MPARRTRLLRLKLRLGGIELFMNGSCPTVLLLPIWTVCVSVLGGTPISAAGIYVPGGTAAYPSSVLMNAIPAAVAGVSRVVAR